MKYSEMKSTKLANGLSPEHGRLTRAELFEAIRHLNGVYGRGDLIEREMHVSSNGRVSCESSLQYGVSKFTARFQGRTVFARGHQVTVKY